MLSTHQQKSLEIPIYNSQMPGINSVDHSNGLKMALIQDEWNMQKNNLNVYQKPTINNTANQGDSRQYTDRRSQNPQSIKS